MSTEMKKHGFQAVTKSQGKTRKHISHYYNEVTSVSGIFVKDRI